MIDKNEKLFGKINIIDLLIILVIIAAAVFFATKAFTPAQEAAKTDTSTVRVQFFCYKAQVGAADAIEIGAPAFEDTTNVDFGKVVAVESEPSYTYFVDADGNQAKAEVAYNDAVTVTVELQGNLTEKGLYVGGRLYGVGASFTMHFGKATIYASVSGVSEAA